MSEETTNEIVHELDIAKQIASGVLTSPQLYMNIALFDLRITGTGASFRTNVENENGEYVYRPPENFLTDDFLQRCNGLPIIVQHPDTSILDSKEFANRIVGTVLLPYIKDNEVWGIAKIYDEHAIEFLTNNQLSTSPGVAFTPASGNQEATFNSDGAALLIEGVPALLDHLAICDQGVWDKGGAPSGVNSINAKENQMDETMTDSVEEKKDATEETVEKKDSSDGGMSSILAALDSISKRLDAMEGAKKDEVKVEGQPKVEPKGDSEAEHISPEAKSNAVPMKEENEVKKDEEYKAMKDRLDRIDAAMGRIDATINMPDAKKDEYTAAQSKCDSVACVHSEQAPRPLSGETVLAYRKRLVGKYKKFSEDWKDIDLTPLDAKTMDIAERRIYADAMEAGLHPTSGPSDILREITKEDRTGRKIKEFIGHPSAWMQDFMCVPQRAVFNNKLGQG